MYYNDIKENFPFYPNFREGQEWALEQISHAFESGKRFVLLEAPTGSGKSALATALSNSADGAYILTIQKFLQDQYMRDFEVDMVDLKGRNAYPCVYYDYHPEKRKTDSYIGCDRGYCKTKFGQSHINECVPGGIDSLIKTGETICPYWRRLYEAIISPTTLMNFHSFLFQMALKGRFSKRELMVIDEAHNAESCLMDYVSFSLNDMRLRDRKIKIPQLSTAEEYDKYFTSIGLIEIIAEEIAKARLVGDSKSEEEWMNNLVRLKLFRDSINITDWIVNFEDKEVFRRIELKPLYVNYHAQHYLFNMADKVFLMSATILDPNIIYKSLGIDPNEACALQMANRFPVKNRQIFYTPSGSLAYRNKQDTYPQLIEDVNIICQAHNEEKGIIHTHNFEIAELLTEKCNGISSRFLFQKNFENKEEMLAEHRKRKDSIIVAPAMHEGLDLIDDEGRFQIICKVPYPSYVDNPQLEARKDLDPGYYDWLTAIKLVQSYGRVNRHEDDEASTYILDADFERFYRNNKKLLPKWFKEAVIMPSK